MDYRYTEDFARQMDAAEWRAHELRGQALASFWRDTARALRGALASWLLARKARRADEELWRIAQSDPRVMADLRHAMDDRR
jgi:hypothetical protein